MTAGLMLILARTDSTAAFGSNVNAGVTDADAVEATETEAADEAAPTGAAMGPAGDGEDGTGVPVVGTCPDRAVELARMTMIATERRHGVRMCDDGMPFIA